MFKWIIEFLESEKRSRKEIAEDTTGVIGEDLKDQQRIHVAEIEKAIAALKSFSVEGFEDWWCTVLAWDEEKRKSIKLTAQAAWEASRASLTVEKPYCKTCERFMIDGYGFCANCGHPLPSLPEGYKLGDLGRKG